MFLMSCMTLQAIALEEDENSTVASQDTVDNTSKVDDPEKKKKMQRNADIGKVMLGGILILAILLFAIVLIIGRRYKRIVREPLPEAKPGDPLWYLKDKKPTEEPAEDEDENLPPS